MTESGGGGCAEPCAGFLALPVDVIAAVLRNLHGRDICRCACVCSAFRAAATDEERVWRPMCEGRWGDKTRPEEWLVEGGEGWRSAASPDVEVPHNYRLVYRLLNQYDQLLGVWQGHDMEHHPRGALFVTQWRSDSIDCVRLVADETNVKRRDYLKLGPWGQVTGQVLDGDHLVLKEYTHMSGSPSMGPAAAAASVAAGTDSGGHSPPRRFQNELLKFMQSSVRSSRRSGSRRPQRTAQGSDFGCVPKFHHMVRLLVPSPTRHTSLAGIWKGSYGPHGVEVIKIEYDFSGSSAQIVATKLIGDPNVPAGEKTWRVHAKPMGGPPWPLMDAPGLGVAFLLSVGPDPIEVHELRELTVVNCHGGHGRVAQAGFRNPEWIEGQLWEYSNGNIGFIWEGGHNFLINFVRAEDDILLES
ncbi:unnamed protein product [Ostreobium quekettii]|uniref:F-box domain-containing protein n=1 Tax=Ostreobium quekettii TaxID=121088 RepID=A0A8S1J769_9CHLO|nr:unnamed protein product [Ostreobium quekettii]